MLTENPYQPPSTNVDTGDTPTSSTWQRRINYFFIGWFILITLYLPILQIVRGNYKFLMYPIFYTNVTIQCLLIFPLVYFLVALRKQSPVSQTVLIWNFIGMCINIFTNGYWWYARSYIPNAAYAALFSIIVHSIPFVINLRYIQRQDSIQ